MGRIICIMYIPAPVMTEPLNDVFPVARAPSKLALVKFA